MPLTKNEKEGLVDEYAEMLSRSKALIFTTYRGLGNKDMTKLRRDIRDASGTYRVTKLSLLKLALEKAGLPVPEEDLTGLPIAVGFCFEEVPGVAKALTDFADESELLEIRGGLMGDVYMTGKQLEAIAELPPLDDLRSQLIGMLDAPAANLVGVVQAGVAQVINVVNAYADSGEAA